MPLPGFDLELRLLYNIQNQLEYPFDNIGMDDINLDNFRIER